MKTASLLIASVIAMGLPIASNAQTGQDAFKYLLGIGFTNGGKTLVTLEFDDGSSDRIASGKLIHLYAGGEYRFTPSLSMQANVGYHVDDSQSAGNGSVKFSRVPVELLGHYRFQNNFRVGGGLRVATNVKLSGSGVASELDIKFKNSTGLVAEAEYLFTDSVGLKLRAVSEKYKHRSGVKVSGDHMGLYLTGYF